MAGNTRYQITASLLAETFGQLRRCGNGHRECQVVWLSPWDRAELITEVVHSSHTASAAGFRVDDQWVTWLWNRLADEKAGVRVQVHTHPGQAFHSHIDDAWPLIHTAGFLSLVLPDFAMGDIGLEGAYLAELGADGRWRQADMTGRLELIR